MCVGGWPLSWNHSAFPSRWAPWHPSGGVPSSSTGNQRGSSTNRGIPWNSNTSQRSWHTTRPATSKYNRWEHIQTINEPKKKRNKKTKNITNTNDSSENLYPNLNTSLSYKTHKSKPKQNLSWMTWAKFCKLRTTLIPWTTKKWIPYSKERSKFRKIWKSERQSIFLNLDLLTRHCPIEYHKELSISAKNIWIIM